MRLMELFEIMGQNNVMEMGQFIFARPELLMLTPRVWRSHYQDEYQVECKLQSFSTALKQYPSLVQIRPLGRYNIYGSAKLSDETIENCIDQMRKVKNKQNNQKIPKRLKKISPKQLNLQISPEPALAEIQNIMMSASQQIEKVFRRTQIEETK